MKKAITKLEAYLTTQKMPPPDIICFQESSSSLHQFNLSGATYNLIVHQQTPAPQDQFRSLSQTNFYINSKFIQLTNISVKPQLVWTTKTKVLQLTGPNGDLVTIIGTHTFPDAQTIRRQKLTQILSLHTEKRTKGFLHPTIICGDFNLPADYIAGKATEFTVSTFEKTLRQKFSADNILFSDQIIVNTTVLPPSLISDHQPLWASVTLQQPVPTRPPRTIISKKLRRHRIKKGYVKRITIDPTKMSSPSRYSFAGKKHLDDDRSTTDVLRQLSKMKNFKRLFFSKVNQSSLSLSIDNINKMNVINFMRSKQLWTVSLTPPDMNKQVINTAKTIKRILHYQLGRPTFIRGIQKPQVFHDFHYRLFAKPIPSHIQRLKILPYPDDDFNETRQWILDQVTGVSQLFDKPLKKQYIQEVTYWWERYKKKDYCSVFKSYLNCAQSSYNWFNNSSYGADYIDTRLMSQYSDYSKIIRHKLIKHNLHQPCGERLMLIPKTKDKLSQKNFRPISIPEQALRIRQSFIFPFLTYQVQEFYKEAQQWDIYQFGSRMNLSCHDAHMLLRAQSIRSKIQQWVSLDMEKAFDSISRQVIIQALEYIKFPPELILHTKAIMSSFFMFQEHLRAYVVPTKGIPQGSTIAPMLFALGLTYSYLLFKKENPPLRYKTFIVYVDDTLVQPLGEDSQKLSTHLLRHAGLKLNASKQVTIKLDYKTRRQYRQYPKLKTRTQLQTEHTLKVQHQNRTMGMKWLGLKLYNGTFNINYQFIQSIRSVEHYLYSLKIPLGNYNNSSSLISPILEGIVNFYIIPAIIYDSPLQLGEILAYTYKIKDNIILGLGNKVIDRLMRFNMVHSPIQYLSSKLKLLNKRELSLHTDQLRFGYYRAITKYYLGEKTHDYLFPSQKKRFKTIEDYDNFLFGIENLLGTRTININLYTGISLTTRQRQRVTQLSRLALHESYNSRRSMIIASYSRRRIVNDKGKYICQKCDSQYFGCDCENIENMIIDPCNIKYKNAQLLYKLVQPYNMKYEGYIDQTTGNWNKYSLNKGKKEIRVPNTNQSNNKRVMEEPESEQSDESNTQQK